MSAALLENKWVGIAARVLSASLGAWVMAAPWVLGYGPPAATLDGIVGPLIVTCDVIAITESTRPVRHANLVLGIALAIAAPIAGGGLGAVITGVLAGLAVALLSRVRGAREHTLGGGWRAIWRRDAST